MLKVYDEDTMSDDFMGFVNVKIQDQFEKPGEFLVDNEYVLQVPKELERTNTQAGKIYVQIR